MAVDPFIERIPDKWVDTNGDYTDQTRQFLEYLVRHLEQNWTNSNQGDAFGELGVRELYSWQGLLDKEPDETKHIYQLISPFLVTGNSDFNTEFEEITVTGNHTTSGNELLVCTNSSEITVTLNTSPENLEQVIVMRRGTGKINYTGTIDGRTDRTQLFRYSSPRFIYLASQNEWGRF